MTTAWAKCFDLGGSMAVHGTWTRAPSALRQSQLAQWRAHKHAISSETAIRGDL
jgi:hypothetical protein